MAKTDEKVQAVVEEELKKNPGATLDELFERAKEASPSVTKLTRRQFNARYPLQIKRRLGIKGGGGGGPRAPRARRAAKKEPARKRPARPRGARKTATAPAPAAEAAPTADREAIRAAFLRFATDVVGAADAPKQLVKVLAGVDGYVDQVAKAKR